MLQGVLFLRMPKIGGVPILVSVSGMEQQLKGRIIEDNLVEVELGMNQSVSQLIEVQQDYAIVNIEGITIVILEGETREKFLKKLYEDEEKAKQEIKKWMQENINTKEKAIGVMLLETIEGKTKINPIVWVKEIDTVFYETACGSGSLGTAIYLLKQTKNQKSSILQPSGYTINITLVEENDVIKKATVSGMVKEVAL